MNQPITPGLYRQRDGGMATVFHVKKDGTSIGMVSYGVATNWYTGRYATNADSDFDLVERIGDLPGTEPAIDRMRFEAAKAAMQALISFPEKYSEVRTDESCARVAAGMADALIEVLKKGKE